MSACDTDHYKFIVDYLSDYHWTQCPIYFILMILNQFSIFIFNEALKHIKYQVNACILDCNKKELNNV